MIRKKILFITVLFVTSFGTVCAQTVTELEKMITQKEWAITGDRQAGIGRHNSMNENSKIRFSADSTWECTDPVLGETKGRWYIKDAKFLYLTPGNSKKPVKCDLIVLNETQLQFRYKQNTAVRTLEWVSEEE
jgi:hypothetical protein